MMAGKGSAAQSVSGKIAGKSLRQAGLRAEDESGKIERKALAVEAIGWRMQ